jgi:hypothetical protein
MTRQQLKCLLAMFASSHKLKIKPGHLDRFCDLNQSEKLSEDDAIRIFVEELNRDIRTERKKAREVETALGPKPKRSRWPKNTKQPPRMTKRLQNECIDAGRDWLRDTMASGRSDDTDGQSEAMDIGACISPHPSLNEACADYVYQGICQELNNTSKRGQRGQR